MTIPETLRAEIEAAACEAVHDAWMRAKYWQGVTSLKSETGEELMVPYRDLSDAAKALDAASIQATLDAALPILEAHYGVIIKRIGDAYEEAVQARICSQSPGIEAGEVGWAWACESIHQRRLELESK
jgi:hypothetical protein